MSDPIYEAFLQRQLAEGIALQRESDLVTLAPAEPRMPPRAWFLELRTRGLVCENGRITEADRWGFLVRFDENYLRERPHPAQVIAFLGPANAWHPNIAPDAPFVCIEVRCGTGLVEICYALHDLVRMAVVGTADGGLNKAASQFVRSQPRARFPVDNRPLKRRAAPATTTRPITIETLP